MIFRTAYSRPYVFLFGIVGLLLIAAIMALACLPGEAVPLPVFVLFGLIAALLAWILFSTRFVIAEGTLTASSGPFRRKIEIADIVKVVYDDQLFKMSLWKIGCSHHGLMIHYGKFDDIYISPERRDLFVSELCRLNPGITVHR